MKRIATKCLLAGCLVFAAPASAATVLDATGDFLPSYVGPHTGDLDVISFSVNFNATTQIFRLSAAFASDIVPNSGALYVIGVNKGGAPSPGPFAAIGQPNVIFNQVVLVRADGTSNLAGINPTISGNIFLIDVPLARLASTGFAPGQYGFNLWPRLGLGNNNQIADFAPENSTLAAVPEPATWAIMMLGFGVIGAGMRRRRQPEETPQAAGAHGAAPA